MGIWNKTVESFYVGFLSLFIFFGGVLNTKLIGYAALKPIGGNEIGSDYVRCQQIRLRT